MLRVPVHNAQRKKVGTLELDPQVFGVDVRPEVLHQVLVNQMANRRQGTAATKTRGQVSGGGKKPWRQKGTGRARAGSIRSPLWRGGGTVFGPQPRDYRYTLPKKLRRLGIRMALSEKVREGHLHVLDRLSLPEPKTKAAQAWLAGLKLGEGSVLVLMEQRDPVFQRAMANLPGVTVQDLDRINVRDLLVCHHLVLTQEGIARLTERLRA